MTAELSEARRALAAVLEPFAAQVYFSKECHDEYVALGFSAESVCHRHGRRRA